MAASITDPRLEALVARVNTFDATTVVNLNNCITAAIAYKYQAIVAVWPPELADEEAAFTDLLKNIVHMSDKAAEQVTTIVGIKQFKDLDYVDDENMRLQLNRIDRRSQEMGKNNRHIW